MRDDRNRQSDLLAAIDRIDPGASLTARQLVAVYDGGSIPTTVPKVFLTHPVTLGGDGSEGATYSTAVDTDVTIPVVVLGPEVPVAGDLLVAHAIGGRWVAEKVGVTESGVCTICVQVIDCNGASVSGALLTVLQSASTIGTGTTDGSGIACVDVSETSSGSYHIDVSKTGYGTASIDGISVTCPGVTSQSVTLSPSTSKTVNFSISMCGHWVINDLNPSISVNGGSYPFVNGAVSLTLPIGAHSYTITGYRLEPYTNSVTVSATCAAIGRSISMHPESGYKCPTWCDNLSFIPVAETLHLTDSIYGPCTLNYNNGASDVGQWEGIMAGVSVAEGCGCSAGSNVSLRYVWPSGDATCAAKVQFTMNPYLVSYGIYCPDDVTLGGGYSNYIEATSYTASAPPSMSSVGTMPICSVGAGNLELYPSGATLTVTE